MFVNTLITDCIYLQNLSPLEERLVALRIPFMQLRAAKVGGQKTMTGSIINVPNNLEFELPRREVVNFFPDNQIDFNY